MTYALMQVGGRATLLPWTAGLVGPLALLAALPLVYLFVRRELGHPVFGLVAAALFGDRNRPRELGEGLLDQDERGFRRRR